MRFDPEVLPELRKSKNPAERRNDFDLALAQLTARSPLPRQDWLERHEERFRHLSRTDDGFRELLYDVTADRRLERLQERLDAE